MGGITFSKQTIRDVPLEGKTVLVRADYNVPLAKDGTIRDDLRIRASLPTLNYLLEHHCKVIIMSHLGRPDGKRDERFSLHPVAVRLAELTGRTVRFADDCVGDEAYQAAKTAAPGSITLYENVRFHPEDEANDEAFAARIAKASKADYFVQDGFGVAHRAHASTEAITHYLPSVAGLLLEKEYVALRSAIDAPKRPLVAILGGAKVSDKIGIIQRFVSKADTILVGGAMANTFLAHAGHNMQSSMVEGGQDATIDTIYRAVADKHADEPANDFLRLPVDVAVARAIEADEPRRVVAVDALAEGDIALDIGDSTIDEYVAVLETAGTVIWNGPVGYSELPNFAHGSARIALALATHPNTISVVGGGDTADFVLHWDASGGKSFTHVSTGGGAGLELMAGKELPGIAALLDARR